MAFDFKGFFKLILVPVEKALVTLVDENMSKLGKDFLKQGADKLIDENYEKLLGGMHGKVRGWIDKIDGVENLPPMPGTDPAPEPAEPAGVPAGM